MITLEDLPALNAGLNSATFCLLSAGWLFIRRRKIAAHRACMLSAVGISVIFLASYVTYHSIHGTTPFPGSGWSRPFYFTVLLTHTALAAATLPLVIVTATRALKGRFDRHVRIARWTLPIWLYVASTGVGVYFMLNHIFVPR